MGAPKGPPKGPCPSFFHFPCSIIKYLSNEANNKSFLQSIKNLLRKQGELSKNWLYLVSLYPYLHTKIRNIIKTSLWKAGQGFLAKFDCISKVEHICQKMTLAFFDIRPTTHLVCTLLFIGDGRYFCRSLLTCYDGDGQTCKM